tara:strand:- start:18 stop:155 length:138 start_codon:yes stop_codon:yes gene_type:complete
MSKIHSELRTVFITPDGFKFFSKQEALAHCEEFNLIKQGDKDGEE